MKNTNSHKVLETLKVLYADNQFKVEEFKEQSNTWYFKISVKKNSVLFMVNPIMCSWGTVWIGTDIIEFNGHLRYNDVDQFLNFYEKQKQIFKESI